VSAGQRLSQDRRHLVHGVRDWVRVVLAPTAKLWEMPTMSESMILVGLDIH